MSNKENQLRFDGSIWCNLDIAMRNVEIIFKRVARPLGLTVVELYILLSLYESDGQHASTLARNVGRAATSFTPNLDKLENKGYVERRADPADRRAIRIHLTQKGEQHRAQLTEQMNAIDAKIAKEFGAKYKTFQQVLLGLQALEPRS